MKTFGQFLHCLNNLDTVRTVLKGSGQCWKRPDTGQFQHCPDSLDTVRTVLKGCGWFCLCTDSFKTVRTVLNCPDSIENVRTVSTLSEQFRHRPDSVENVRTLDREFLFSCFPVCKKINKLSSCLNRTGDNKKSWFHWSNPVNSQIYVELCISGT